jgi:hypothetical protein
MSRNFLYLRYFFIINKAKIKKYSIIILTYLLSLFFIFQFFNFSYKKEINNYKVEIYILKTKNAILNDLVKKHINIDVK